MSDSSKDPLYATLMVDAMAIRKQVCTIWQDI